MANTADFIPPRESELVTWSNNFNTLINATPVAYGLTSAQTMTYTSLHDAFVSAYQIANDNSTRTPSNIVTKDDAKDVMIDNARKLVGIVQADPSVTDTQRSDLEINVPDTEPTPVPVPRDAPALTIVSIIGRTVKIRLRDVANPDRRGKPDGVNGAIIMSAEGVTPPSDIGEWKLEMNLTRTTADVTFPAALAAGAQVWLTAYWYNTKGESGPAAAPQTTNIAGGLSQAA